MIKNLSRIFILSIICSGCISFTPIERKDLLKSLPNNHVFNIPLDSLKVEILKCFSIENQCHSDLYKSLIFYYYFDTKDINSKMLTTFKTETSIEPLFSKEFYKKIGTVNDIYLHSFGQFWNSPIFYTKNRPLRFRAEFGILLKALNENQTELKIMIENPRVLKGISGIGPHGFIIKEISVNSTTVEEYCLLLYIANSIGDKTFPMIELNTVIK